MLAELIWTLGRLGSRLPLEGSAAVTIAASTAERWLDKLLQLPVDDLNATQLTAMHLAGRTNGRFTDNSQAGCDKPIRYVKEMSGHRNLISLISDGGRTDSETQAAVFGESLPVGLRMRPK